MENKYMKYILSVMMSVIVLPLLVLMMITPPGKVTLLICTFYNHESYGRACNMLDQPLIMNMRKTDVRFYGSDGYRETISYVNIFNTSFEFIPEQLFKSFGNLEVLEIYNTTLSVLDERTFANAGSLKQLYMKNNRIKFLDDKIFSHLKHLEILDLEGNQLEYLGEGLLSNNYNLQHVNLKNNKIHSIDANLFGNLTKLRKLEMNGNFCTRKNFEGDDLKTLNVELQTCFDNAKNNNDAIEKLAESFLREKSELYALEDNTEIPPPELIPNSIKMYYFLVLIGYVLYNLWNKLVHGQPKKTSTTSKDD